MIPAATVVLGSGEGSRLLMHGLLVAIVVVAALVGFVTWRRRRNAEQLTDDEFGAHSDESAEPGEPQ